MTKPIWPESPEQLEEAADAAVFMLGLDAAWQYGLIEPDPKADIPRCQEILAEAKARGVVIRSLAEVLAGPRTDG